MGYSVCVFVVDLLFLLFHGSFCHAGPTKTLIVKGLSEDTTEESLKESFEGAISARVVTDRETGAPKG